MNESCRNYRGQLADAAEGKLNAELARHLEACAKCAELVRRYREILDAAKQAWEPAPADLIAMAKSFMPSTRRTWVARRLGTSLLAGARSGSEEFQVVAGTDDVSVRLMATRLDRGWEVMGRLPEGDWEVESTHPVDLEPEGFRLRVPSLEDSEFALVGASQTIEVPSISRLLDESN